MGKTKQADTSQVADRSMDTSTASLLDPTTPTTPQSKVGTNAQALRDLSWEDSLTHLSEIAAPLASKKLTKRIVKLVRKASKHKSYLRKGIKEVQRFIRKGEKGVVVMAGNTRPVDVICHLPMVCEEKSIPYCYIPLKEELGGACGSKRPTCVVMVRQNADYQEAFDDCSEQIRCLPLPLDAAST